MLVATRPAAPADDGATPTTRRPPSPVAPRRPTGRSLDRRFDGRASLDPRRPPAVSGEPARHTRSPSRAEANRRLRAEARHELQPGPRRAAQREIVRRTVRGRSGAHGSRSHRHVRWTSSGRHQRRPQSDPTSRTSPREQFTGRAQGTSSQHGCPPAGLAETSGARRSLTHLSEPGDLCPRVSVLKRLHGIPFGWSRVVRIAARRPAPGSDTTLFQGMFRGGRWLRRCPDRAICVPGSHLQAPSRNTELEPCRATRREATSAGSGHLLLLAARTCHEGRPRRDRHRRRQRDDAHLRRHGHPRRAQGQRHPRPRRRRGQRGHAGRHHGAHRAVPGQPRARARRAPGSATSRSPTRSRPACAPSDARPCTLLYR